MCTILGSIGKLAKRIGILAGLRSGFGALYRFVRPKRKTVVAVLSVMVATVLVIYEPASAGTTNLVPNGDFGTQGWIATGTGGSTCTGAQCDLVDENFSTPDTANYISTGTAGAGGEIDEFTMDTFIFPNGVTEVTSIAANIYAQSATNANGGTLDTVSVSLFINGAYLTAVNVTPAFNTWGWLTATFTGTWTQAQIDDMRLRVVHNVVGGGNAAARDDDIRIATAYTTATYPTNVAFGQSASRWFANADSVTPGAALAAQDTAITAPEQGTPFRLRLLIDIATNPLTVNSQSFKLQVAAKSGTCDTAFTGETYSDLSATAGAIRFFNNPATADAAATTSIAGDPAHLTHVNRLQTYIENPTFANTTAAIAAGEDGLWDFSLVDYSATPGTSYCFRAVKADATVLTTYTVIPEITTALTDTGVQYKGDHLTKVSTGETVIPGTAPNMFLDFYTTWTATSETVTPQFEIKDTATSFTGTPTHTGTKVSTGVNKMPETRFAACSAYDSTAKRMITFGGRARDGTLHYNDAWALNTPANAQPSWVELTTQGAAGSPPAIRSCTAAYDSTANRFIIWNGWNGTTQYTDVWTLSLGDTPAWTQLCTSTSCGTAPSVRRSSRMVYDTTGNQLIIWGGYNGSNLNDTWRLTLGATPTWTQLTPTGGPPVARGAHAFAYDPVNRLAWMFGGSALAGDMNDTWKYDIAANTWTQVFANACASPCPIKRDGSTMVYDSLNRRMVVFAGYDTAADVFLSDFSILSNLDTTPTWSSPTPASSVPEPRYYHTAVYDDANQRMVAFSGYDANVVTLNKDISSLNLPSGGATPYWSGIAAGNVWNGRDQMAMYYDATNKFAYSFGGFGNGTLPGANNSGVHIAETLRLEASTSRTPRWRNASSQSQANGAAPLAREATNFASDTTGKRLFVFGGLHGDFGINDTWVADMSVDGRPSWRLLCSPTSCGTAPPTRWGGTAVYDANSDRFVIFGGRNAAGTVNYNDVWSLSLGATPTWTQLAPTGTAPGGRWGGATVYDSVNDRMIIWGGQANPDATATRYNDTWALSLGAAPAWTQLTPTGTAPAARRSMAYDLSTAGGGRKLVVFGGYNGTVHYNDIFVLDLGTTNGAWTNPFPSDCANASAPSCRRSTGAVYDPVDNRYIIIAGRDGTKFDADSFSFNLTSNTWTNLNPINELGFSVPISSLSDNNYHWQYRTSGSTSGVSGFISYGSNTDAITAATDFAYCQAPGPQTRMRLGTYFCGQSQQNKYLPQ